MNTIYKIRPRLIYVSWLLPPFRAMTIPPFGIFIKKQYKGNLQILKHDLTHWHQFQRMGFFLFYFRYFFQLLTVGYDYMPMEIEARMSDSKGIINNYRRKYHK